MHPLQVHGLRRRVPGRLLLRRPELPVIDPDECIDCGVCIPECPVKAIVPDTEAPGASNGPAQSRLSRSWPKITRKKPPPDADDWKGVTERRKILNCSTRGRVVEHGLIEVRRDDGGGLRQSG